MDGTTILIILAIGAIAGWIAGLVFKGQGFGLLGNIVIGILGGVIGGWLMPKLGIHLGGGIGGTILIAVLGALALLLVVNILKKA
ncbi:MAG: GlsB/YeaQ/YmgE family stress response membrane protein [Chitinophagaceae bacterium]